MNDQAPTQALTAGVWLTIDATLDNAISNLIDGGHGVDSAEVTRAQALRKRGWAVSRQHPQRGLGPVGWPPREAPFDVPLSDDDLGYLLGLLTHEAGVIRRILVSETHASVMQQQEESLTLVQEALGALARISPR